MRKLVILYNILFLLVGNVLLSNVHFHNHEHEHENVECHDCILIESSNNYILEYEEVFFKDSLNDEFNEYSFILIPLIVNTNFLSRAPPIS